MNRIVGIVTFRDMIIIAMENGDIWEGHWDDYSQQLKFRCSTYHIPIN